MEKRDGIANLFGKQGQEGRGGGSFVRAVARSQAPTVKGMKSETEERV